MPDYDMDMAGNTLKRILLVEDDRDISHLVELHLKDRGYEVRLAFDGTSGLAMARKDPYDLIILDLMLPGMDGMEICRKVREQEKFLPILMLTAKSSEADRVSGLDAGADDYLTKPFSIRELLARVKAIFRRVDLMSLPEGEGEDLLATGHLTIDAARRKVTMDGNRVKLTAREYDLLYHFARNPGKVYTRSQLLDQVWGYGYEGYEHTVNSHINRLRGKIEQNPAKPEYILTVWGVGYRFAEPAELTGR